MSNLGPLADPIDELIVRNVVETLGLVSTRAGFLVDLIVERPNQKGNAPRARDGLCIVDGGNPIPQPRPPCGFDEFVLPIGVCIHAVEPEQSGVTIRQRLSVFAADVRRALTQDVHRGRLAVNTEFDAKDEFNESGKPATVIVWPRIRYRTLWNDPYRQRR